MTSCFWLIQINSSRCSLLLLLNPFSSRCSLFLVGGDPATNSQYLESNLFDVRSDSTVEEVSKNEIKINWGVGIVGHVAQTGVSCNVSDCYQDSRYILLWWNLIFIFLMIAVLCKGLNQGFVFSLYFLSFFYSSWFSSPFWHLLLTWSRSIILTKLYSAQV